jgi:orotidine-5'-phosphate decarboxylase
MYFIDKLTNRLDKMNSHLCVGLDTQYDKIPKSLRRGKSIHETILDFNKNIISVTNHVTIAYKINTTFYEGFGLEGIKALHDTNMYIKKNFPQIPIFADTKRAEMGNSAEMLKKYIFEWLNFDCLMVTPWFGFDTLKDLMNDKSYGILVYVHDSNQSASDIQDLQLIDGSYVYEKVAELVVKKWNKYGNVIVEAGVTYPIQLKRVRDIVGDNMPILTAGIVNQGGDINDLKGLFGKNHKRLIVNSSRGIIFAGKSGDTYFDDVQKSAENIKDLLWKASIKQ